MSKKKYKNIMVAVPVLLGFAGISVPKAQAMDRKSNYSGPEGSQINFSPSSDGGVDERNLQRAYDKKDSSSVACEVLVKHGELEEILKFQSADDKPIIIPYNFFEELPEEDKKRKLNDYIHVVDLYCDKHIKSLEKKIKYYKNYEKETGIVCFFERSMTFKREKDSKSFICSALKYRIFALKRNVMGEISDEETNRIHQLMAEVSDDRQKFDRFFSQLQYFERLELETQKIVILGAMLSF